MAEEAVRRMRETSARSNGGGMPPMPPFLAVPDAARPFAGTFSSPPPRSDPKGFRLLRMLNLDRLRMDNDTLVILLLILVLSSEESDELLLLALLYILM